MVVALELDGPQLARPRPCWMLLLDICVFPPMSAVPSRDCCAIIVTQFETEIGRGCVILKPSFSTDGVILVSM